MAIILPYGNYKNVTITIAITRSACDHKESEDVICDNTIVETVTILAELNNIGEEAFSGCNNLMEIKNGSKKVINCNENVFADVAYDNATLYVPKGRKIFYERKSPWNKFIIEEFDDVDTFV